jgi:hypothetical protein
MLGIQMCGFQTHDRWIWPIQSCRNRPSNITWFHTTVCGQSQGFDITSSACSSDPFLCKVQGLTSFKPLIFVLVPILPTNFTPQWSARNASLCCTCMCPERDFLIIYPPYHLRLAVVRFGTYVRTYWPTTYTCRDVTTWLLENSNVRMSPRVGNSVIRLRRIVKRVPFASYFMQPSSWDLVKEKNKVRFIEHHKMQSEPKENIHTRTWGKDKKV